MAFMEYEVRDGQRVADVLRATHDVRTAAMSLKELLDQIDEQILVLSHAKELAKEETKKSLTIILG